MHREQCLLKATYLPYLLLWTEKINKYIKKELKTSYTHTHTHILNFADESLLLNVAALQLLEFQPGRAEATRVSDRR